MPSDTLTMLTPEEYQALPNSRPPASPVPPPSDGLTMFTQEQYDALGKQPNSQQRNTATDFLKVLRNIAVGPGVRLAEAVSPFYKEVAAEASQRFAGGLATIPESAAILSDRLSDEIESLGLGRMGAPSRTEDMPTYKLGRLIRETAAQVFPIDESQPKTFLKNTLPGAAGSMGSFIALGGAGMLAKIPALLTTLVAGAAQGGADAYDEAGRMGGTEDQKWTAFVANGLAGATESIPIAGWLSRANKATGGRLWSAIKGGAQETAQEVFQQYVNNVTASDIAGYDPTRPATAGIVEGGGAGAILGTAGGLLFHGGRRNVRPPPIPLPDSNIALDPQGRPLQTPQEISGLVQSLPIPPASAREVTDQPANQNLNAADLVRANLVEENRIADIQAQQARMAAIRNARKNVVVPEDSPEIVPAGPVVKQYPEEGIGIGVLSKKQIRKLVAKKRRGLVNQTQSVEPEAIQPVETAQPAILNASEFYNDALALVEGEASLAGVATPTLKSAAGALEQIIATLEGGSVDPAKEYATLIRVSKELKKREKNAGRATTADIIPQPVIEKQAEVKPVIPINPTKAASKFGDVFNPSSDAHQNILDEMGFRYNDDNGRLYMTGRDNEKLYLSGQQLKDAKLEFLNRVENQPETKPATIAATPVVPTVTPETNTKQQRANATEFRALVNKYGVPEEWFQRPDLIGSKAMGNPASVNVIESNDKAQAVRAAVSKMGGDPANFKNDDLSALLPKLKAYVDEKYEAPFRAEQQAEADAMEESRETGDEVAGVEAWNPEPNEGKQSMARPGAGLTPEAVQSAIAGKVPANSPTVHIIRTGDAVLGGRTDINGFTLNGEIYLVADRLPSPELAAEVFGEELAHIAFANPQAQNEIDSIAISHITEENRQSIRDMGYEQGPNETASQWERRQNEEWIAKQELGNTPWWKDLINRFVEWLKTKFKVQFTNSQAIRAFKRTWLARISEPIGTSSRQSLVRNVEEAANVNKLTRSATERADQGKLLMSQGEVATVLEKHGAGTAELAVRNELGFQDWLGMRMIGSGMSGGFAQGYQQVRAFFAGNPWKQTQLALETATQWRRAQIHLNGVIAAGVEARKRMASTGFQNLILRLAKADTKNIAAEYASTLSGAVFDSALTEAATALKAERLSDTQQAVLEGQVKEIQASKDSRFAIGQIMADMVKTISVLKDGYELLNDPAYSTVQVLTAAFTDLKTSTRLPMSDPRLVNWAARILSRSSTLRSKLLAAQLAQGSNLKSTLGPYAASLAAELGANPVAAIRKWRREAVKLTTDRNKAAFIYKELFDDYTEQIERFTVLDEAATIAENVMNDPDRIAFVAEIRADTGIDANDKSVLPLVENMLVLPSKKVVDISASTGDKLVLGSKRAEIISAVQELQNFLANNPQDENYGQHSRNLDTLLKFHAGSMYLNPQGKKPIFSYALGIMRQAANQARSVVGEQFRKVLTILDNEHKKAIRWKSGYGPQWTVHRIAALRSHGLRGKIEDMNQEWLKKAGNELASGHSNGEHPLRVGDRIGQHGWLVTKEDMADLVAQSDATTLGYDMVGDSQTTERTMGQVVMYGRAVKTQKVMVPRMYSDSMTVLAKDFMVLKKAHDTTPTPATEKALHDFLELNFSRMGYSFVVDRGFQFANAGPFDGEGGAFQQVADLMQRNPRAIQSFDQLYDAVSQRSSLTKDETKAWILNEYGQQIEKYDTAFNKDDNSKLKNIPRSDETKNNFTRSRNNQLAPFNFYRNGFHTSDDVNNFAAGMASRSHDLAAAGLTNIVADIKRQIDDLTTKVNQGKTRKAVISKQQQDVQNAKNFDDYQALEARLNRVQGILNDFTGNRVIEDVDSIMSRTIGVVTGNLIGTASTFKNYSAGPAYLGHVHYQLMGSILRAYPMAAWYNWINYGARYGFSGAVGVAKAVAFDLPVGVFQGTIGLINPNTRTAGHFASKAFGRVLDELGTNIYMRVRDYRMRVANGDQVHTNHREEFDARVLGAWVTAGQIHERPISGVKAGPTAILELLYSTFNKTLNPAFGDAIMNSANSAMMKSSAGPVAMHERALRRVFEAWKKSGYRAFDFADPGSEINTLTYREMFPNVLSDPLSLRFATSRDDMVNMLRFYKDAGIDFHVRAAEFLRDLDNKVPNARFLTNEEADAMTTWAINRANRSSRSNNPMGLQKNDAVTMLIRPFQFWNTRIFATFLESVAVPLQSGKPAMSEAQLNALRARQWAFWTTAILLPTLIAFAAVGVGDEEMARQMRLALYNTHSAYRQPWEREGAKSQAIGWTIAAANTIPFANMAVTAALNDMPSRASFDPSLVMVEKAKSAASYVGGVIQTGDPAYRLPEFIGGMFPDARIILNRLESQEGKRELSNVAALGRRLGPQDLLRPGSRGSTGATATELTPYGNRLANAAATDNWSEFDTLRNEAVEKARSLGKPNPEQLVEQLYRSRDPLGRVFRTKLTDEQESAFLGRLTQGQSGSVAQTQSRYRQGLARLKTRRTTRTARLGGGSSRRRSRLGGLGRSRSRLRIPRLGGRTRRLRLRALAV